MRQRTTNKKNKRTGADAELLADGALEEHEREEEGHEHDEADVCERRRAEVLARVVLAPAAGQLHLELARDDVLEAVEHEAAQQREEREREAHRAHEAVAKARAALGDRLPAKVFFGGVLSGVRDCHRFARGAHVRTLVQQRRHVTQHSMTQHSNALDEDGAAAEVEQQHERAAEQRRGDRRAPDLIADRDLQQPVALRGGGDGDDDV